MSLTKSHGIPTIADQRVSGMNGDTNIRSAEGLDKRHILPDDIDRTILQRGAEMVSTNSQCGLRISNGVTSHPYVILAACQQGQKAHEIRHKDDKSPEQWRGFFTVSLLGVLRQLEQKRFTSYRQLIVEVKARMRQLADHGQDPECRGADSFHQLFTRYNVEVPRINQQGKATIAGKH